MAKFISEIQDLEQHDWPMCRTILDKTGRIAQEGLSLSTEGNFACRLIKHVLGSQVREMTKTNPKPTVDDIKLLVEAALKDREVVKKVNWNNPRVQKATILTSDKIAVRRLMSCVWDNSSIFALELGSAAIRQSLFVDKMMKLDWLHSPAASSTMKRLLIKYQRFIDIMAESPGRIVVPTLDVDLAWHTHRK